jgi:hypothetical protein
MKRTKGMYMLGIGIWIGAGVYSAINMLMNLKSVAQSHILNYNYIITGVAVAGLIINIILMKRAKK